MTVKEKLEGELSNIKDDKRLRDIILTLSGALLNVKDLSESLTKLKIRLKKDNNTEDAAYLRYITILLTMVASNTVRRKKT